MTNNNADDYANARIGIYFPGFPAPYTGQCVSLIKWYLGEMCQVDNWQIARGDAKDFGDTLVKEGLAYIVSEANRKRGDIVVWKKDGGGYGHIGVLCSGDNVFEENVSVKGTPSTQISDGNGGFTTVYASRLDPLYASYRKGEPTFYRVYGYQETNAITQPVNQTNQGDDMIDQNTLTILFNEMLGRNPDDDAINHYVGKYTTSFVVADIKSGSEYAQKTANESNYISSINTQISTLNAQLAACDTKIAELQGQLSTEQAKDSGLAKNISDLNLKLNAEIGINTDLNVKLNDAQTQITTLQAKLDAKTPVISTPITEPVVEPVTVPKSHWYDSIISAIMSIFNKGDK